MQKYDQIKTLGQGGFGKAILAKRKADGVQVVIKEVRLTSLGPKDREEALKEVKVLASLKHPYIVDYFESFQERGCLYIVMGFADGGDLAQKVEKAGRRLLTEDEVLHDFIEIALAIKYIHDRKILHRDLKGQNVFLMKDGTIKLGDFGIARVLEHTFQVCRTQIGTPYYLSPEICQGRNYNMKTDIWSLGCILYELCTLKHAFEAGNMNQLLMNIVRGKYTPIASQYSQDLRDLLDRMLTKEPEKRPNINQILATPYIKSKLSNFLEKTMLDYEMKHTIIHGRKPFAQPTIVPRNDPLPIEQHEKAPAGDRLGGRPVANNNNKNIVNYKDEPTGFTQRREDQKKKMEELKKKQMDLDQRIKKREMELLKKEEEVRKKQEEQKRKIEIREAELRKQEEMIAKREKEEKARFEAKAKELQKQRQAAAKIQYDQRSIEIKKQQEIIAKREKEEIAKLAAREKQIQQQLANPNLTEFDRRAIELKRKEDELNRREKEVKRKIEEQDQMECELRNRAADIDKRGGAKSSLDDEKKRLYAEQQQQLQLMKQKDAAANIKNDRRKEIYAEYGNKYDDVDDRLPRPKQQQQNNQRDEDAERMRLYMEQRREAQANRERQRNQELGGSDAMDALRDPDYDERYEKAHNNNNNRKNQQELDDGDRRRMFMEQKRAAQANRDRMRQMEMGGGELKDALYNGGSDSSDDDDKNKRNNQNKGKKGQYDEDAMKEFYRQQRHEAQANRDRLRQAEYGGDNERGGSPQQKEQHGGAKNKRNERDDEDRDDYKPPQKNMNVDEINAYMREQRHQARANKARAAAAEGESQLAKEMRENQKNDEPLPQKKKEAGLEEINAYMREQRHQARANREKAAQSEMEEKMNKQKQDNNKKVEGKVNNPADNNDSDDDDPPPPQKKKDMSLAEINAFMREQRHQRRANKAKAEAELAGINMDDLIAQAEAEQRANPKLIADTSSKKKNDKNAQPQNANVNANADEDSDDEALPQKEKKKDMNLAEINAFMREQRHQRRANKAKAEAELAGINMDELIAQAEAEQRANPQIIEQQNHNSRSKSKPSSSSSSSKPEKEKPKSILKSSPDSHQQQQKEKPNSNPNSSSQKHQAEFSEPAPIAAAPAKMTIAEARRQAAAKKTGASADGAVHHEPRQKSAPPPEKQRVEICMEPQEAVGSARSRGEQLLDKEAMKELFVNQRNEIRINRERIKAAQDGSHDPSLMLARNSSVPQVKIQPQSARNGSNGPLKTSARRILSNISPRKPASSSQSTQDRNLPPNPTIVEDTAMNDSEPKLDLSMALNSKSAGEFLKSRSIVLDNLNDIENENDEDNDDENGNELNCILEQANLLNEALDINENDAQQEDDNDEDDRSSKQQNENRKSSNTNEENDDEERQPGQFYLQNKALNFPVVKDSDSLSYRCEAIRAFLEREIGLEKVIALKHAVADAESEQIDMNKLLDDFEPGIIVLAQQLMVLEESSAGAKL